MSVVWLKSRTMLNITLFLNAAENLKIMRNL